MHFSFALFLENIKPKHIVTMDNSDSDDEQQEPKGKYMDFLTDFLTLYRLFYSLLSSFFYIIINCLAARHALTLTSLMEK